ncbi:hypothetical protein BBJ28_00026808, partial [Nothophytophthora sp. Chile5]
RPSARRSALTTERSQEGFFEIPRLIRLLVARPGIVMGWKLVDTFDITIGGISEPSEFLGVVTAMRVSDGVFVWSARFDDEDLRDYEAESLARAMNRADQLGVPVTG